MAMSDRRSSNGRIATLDGWRGIAILLVLFHHAQTGLRGSARFVTGQHGVTIFFVLSGYLITAHLIREPIDLKSFYTRRCIRLWPTAWAYLGMVILIDLFSRFHSASIGEIASCLFFYRNYYRHPLGMMTVHYWSLSVEEQFYLCWPLVLLVCGKRRSAWIAAGGAIGCALWRFLHWSYYNRNFIDERTEVRADALFIGCLLALLMSDERGRAFVRRWFGYLTAPALAGLIYYIWRFTWLPPLGESLCIAVLIGASVDVVKGPIRCLGWRPLAGLGMVSYSVYVWQQYCLDIYRALPNAVLMMCILVVFAWISYEYIEKPSTLSAKQLTYKQNDAHAYQ